MIVIKKKTKFDNGDLFSQKNCVCINRVDAFEKKGSDNKLGLQRHQRYIYKTIAIKHSF
jgi:hypothetical protein